MNWREYLKKIITEAVDNHYDAGYMAGYNARMVEEKEEHDHNLLDLYRRGYKQGYDEAKAEIGEITIEDMVDFAKQFETKFEGVDNE